VTRLRRLVLGFMVTTAVAAGTALVSAWPVYRTIPEGAAMLKLSISHGGERTCRALTAEELSRLPPNMRRTEVCDRERQPVYLELDIDGETVFASLLPPSGLAGDGPSHAYERFVLAAGEHRVAVRLRDSMRAEGFDASAERTVTLAPAQNLAIDFDPENTVFVFGE